MKRNNNYIKKLVDEALAVEVEAAKEAGALGYIARALVQATMPHKRIETSEFSRKNGAFVLVMFSPAKIGLPYGSIPRLIMSWITTEAVKTKSKELMLGDSLSEFMRELDLIPTGGRWGSITRLKEQMKKLFSAAISCTYNNGDHWEISNVQPVEKANLWWNPKQPDQATIWQSNLVLNDTFFKEVITNPVPIDMRVLKAIKRSPMALDIYCWLTYRMSYLKRATEIPWIALQAQFGSGYAQSTRGTRDFKRAFLRELRKVQQFYSSIYAENGENGLILKPSFSHISKEANLPIANKIKENSIPESEKFFEKMKKLYTRYKCTSLVEIIENELKEKEKRQLLQGFTSYLIRNQVKKINFNSLNDSVVQEWLYRFVDNHWHHLIDQIKCFEDFLAENSSTDI